MVLTPKGKGKAASAPASQETKTKDELLKDHKVFFAEDEFDEDAKTILTANVEALGGQVTEDRSESTILLLNPASQFYLQEQEKISKNLKDKTASQRHYFPYHWLTLSLYNSTWIPIRELTPSKPIFTHPDRSKGNHPLKVWVSVNVPRHIHENTAEEAQANTIKTLIKGGALIVIKRAQADVLIVDPTSKFFEIVKAEKEKHGRIHQRLAERDWVEACFNDGELVFRTIGQEEEEEMAKDSFGEEDQAESKRSGKGPGRPTGKPRVDYSSADDEFLIRYLAAFSPSGSWSSRKTYEVMVSYSDEFPPAGRHTYQSWHERYKKNASSFSSRIHRKIDAGIDKTLKTAEEREKEAGKKTSEEGKKLVNLTGIAAEHTAGASKSANPVSLNENTVPESSAKGRKPLVELDSESDPSQNQVPDTNVDSTTIIRETISATVDSIAEPPTVTESSQLREDSILVEETLGPAQSIDSSSSQKESQQTDSSNGHDARLAGAETQAILNEFQQAKAAIQQADSSVLQPLASTSRATSVPREERTGRTASPAKRARYTEPVQQNGFTPSRIPDNYAVPRSALRQTVMTEDGSGRQIISVPVKLNFRVGIEQEGSTEEESDIPQPNNGHRNNHETPSPGRRRSLLRDHLSNQQDSGGVSMSVLGSGQGDGLSRRRSRLSHGEDREQRRSLNKRRWSPDMVYASPNIPPPPPNPLRDSIRSSSRVSTREPSPMLSNRERMQKVAEGQEIATKAKEEFKQAILRLMGKYGIQSAIELYKQADSVKGRGEAGLGMDEIERRLDRKYGLI